MNEITKIHLGRQAFTISIDAHHELRSYLDAIKKQVRDKEVVDEIEMRMAELLAEHGIDGNKVILPEDVDFLKAQLGNPKEFSEDLDETIETESKKSDSKRLFRDSEAAIIAGVASGLSKYFGLDVLLIRLLFIIFTVVTAGWGILLYIVLWLLVPEAKTSSERLQMVGKPVTVDSLKETVENADIKGAARRANSVLAGPINNIFRIILKLISLLFIFSGLSALIGLIAAETYFLLHSNNWSRYNIFPVGLREHILLDIVGVVAALISVFVVLFGIAMFRRKWPVRTWVTGMLIGLVFIGIAVGASLTADVYPDVRNRYNANLHTTIIYTKPFTSFNGYYSDEDFNFVVSDKYFVSLNYYGHPNLSTIKTSVNNGVLTIDTSSFNPQRNCATLCIPNSYNLGITIYSPNAQDLMNGSFNSPPMPTAPLFIKRYNQN